MNARYRVCLYHSTLVEYDNYVEELFEYKLILVKNPQLKSCGMKLSNAEGKIYVHRTSIEQLKNAKKVEICQKSTI